MATAEALPLSKSAQLTNTLLMISPDNFGFNDQTAATNSFQNNLNGSEAVVRSKALSEFNATVDTLRSHGMEIVVCPSRTDVTTPDAVFPNNWISFHSELDKYDVVLYPMLAPNRRAERQFDTVQRLIPTIGKRVLDMTRFEQSGRFLEGTGSLIFDRPSKTVFAHQSPRTSYEALDAFCEKTGYHPVKFHAFDRQDKPIYHTNVVMSIGAGFSVVSLESVAEPEERSEVEERLRDLGLEIIDISLPQVNNFCGNILHVMSATGEPKILMSQTAHDAFTVEQRRILAYYGDLIPVDIPTIETVGGGSARCMFAEVFPGKYQSLHPDS